MTSNARPARSSSRKSPRTQSLDSRGEQLMKIGEAAKALAVEAYVLRFWETQFPFLRPRHTQSKHRFYSAQDLRTLKMIKRLLHEERFTIEGAKKYIREVGLERAMSGEQPSPSAHKAANSHKERATSSDSTRRTLAEVRRELESLHKMLDS